MRTAHCLIVSVLAIGLAAAAVAADPQPAPQAPAAPATVSGQPGAVANEAAAPTAGLVDIPENQAERQALEAGELQLEAPEGQAAPTDAAAARTARRAAIDAVVAEQDARVGALIARLEGADGEQALALQREIEREKAATGRRLLELQLQFAQQAGDQAGVERLQGALAEWDAPKPVGTPRERTLPATQNR